MSWSAYHVEPGFNRKKEIEKNLNGEVLKSSTTGGAYYAALKMADGTIKGVVVYTELRNKEYHNFFYSVESEDMGPTATRCPEAILNLLSPTDNEFALKWRKSCRQFNENRFLLNSFPVGLKIMCDGEIYTKKKFGNKIYWTSKLGYKLEPDIAEKGFELL